MKKRKDAKADERLKKERQLNFWERKRERKERKRRINK